MAISHYRWHLLAVKSFSRGHCDCVREALIKLAFKSSREEITIRYKNWLLIYLSIWPFTWISIWISIWIFIWLFSLLTTDLMQFLWNFQVRSDALSANDLVALRPFDGLYSEISFYSVASTVSAWQTLPTRTIYNVYQVDSTYNSVYKQLVKSKCIFFNSFPRARSSEPLWSPSFGDHTSQIQALVISHSQINVSLSTVFIVNSYRTHL